MLFNHLVPYIFKELNTRKTFIPSFLLYIFNYVFSLYRIIKMCADISLSRKKQSPLKKLNEMQRKLSVERCPIVFPSPKNGPKVLTKNKSVA